MRASDPGLASGNTTAGECRCDRFYGLHGEDRHFHKLGTVSALWIVPSIPCAIAYTKVLYVLVAMQRTCAC
jgi:hypothetical protein